MTPFGPLAITADDYGLTDGINEGILSLARRQAITGVSVMCHPAARLERVSQLKNTGVLTGVHLVLSEERPLRGDDRGLKPILDRRGRLPDGRGRLFRLVALKPWILPALRREVADQIDRFVELGLSLDFINSHQQVHLFPPLWFVLRSLLESYKVPIRGCGGWDWRGWTPQGRVNLSSWISWRLAPRVRHALSLKPMGLDWAGRFSLEAAREMFAAHREGTGTEIPELVVHPGRMDRAAAEHYAHWNIHWDQELAALESESVTGFFEQQGCDLLVAAMRIRERGGESTTFATRSHASEVVLALAWPQTWDQVVLYTRLIEGLTRKGHPPRHFLPDLLYGLERHHFERYRAFSTGRRILDLWFWLRSLDRRIGNDLAVLHLLLPSPAWAWVTSWMAFPGERILLHYGGRAVAWDWATFRSLADDPWLVGRAMLGNPGFLSRRAGRVAGGHLTMEAATARALTAMGCAKVFQCPGLVEPLRPWQGPTFGEWKPGPDVIRLGFSGMGTPLEGIDDLLRALAMAVADNPRLRLLLVVEEGQRVVTVRKTLQKLGLTERVDLVESGVDGGIGGRVDVMVLPYRSALVAPLYPRALLDAACHECLVITTAISAWEHLFELTSPRLEIVSPGDVGALKRIFVTLNGRMDRARGGPAPLKAPTGHQGMEALAAIHQRMAGGRFIPTNC
ncbi:MAG: ChbG/HpnK family deacetylase [Magnetococcales bacterium]|nr:ChbG/HpnK family deacetylase [Magnetococcales bacterium]